MEYYFIEGLGKQGGSGGAVVLLDGLGGNGGKAGPMITD